MKYLLLFLLSIVTTKAVTLLADDFTTSIIGTTFRAYEHHIDNGWQKAIGYNAVVESEWMVSNGTLGNASTVDGLSYPTTQPSESPVFNMFSSLGISETHIQVSFDYDVADNDTMWAHFWGFTGEAVTPNGFVSNIEASANGNMHVSEGAGGSTLDGFNLKDGATINYGGNSNSFSGALTGSGTFNQMFKISDLNISGITTVADINYFMIQFAKDEDGTAGNTFIDNLSITTVPEASSALLASLSCLLVVIRRR